MRQILHLKRIARRKQLSRILEKKRKLQFVCARSWKRSSAAAEAQVQKEERVVQKAVIGRS